MSTSLPIGSGVPGEIAIVGMACVFPGAPNLQTYWENIIHKVSAVGDPPPEWEAELFLDAGSDANDRLYCARGGYLGALAEFNPADYGIMPNSVDGTEPDHFLALRAAYGALADADYLNRPFNRDRTEVIIGRGTYVNRGNTTVIQHGVVVDSVLRILRRLHPEHSEDELSEIKRDLKASLPAFHAETAPGLVPNIISGRIANRLDLMGSNYVIDAACASSLVALDLGMTDLLTGRCDLAIVGGVHASTPPPIVMIFCQLNAISRRGEIRPFDSRADGTLLGEGVGMIALKRRDDAERDGDRIYALVKGMGVASDGRALGLLAPRREGEELALRRAYAAAGVAPATVGLVEGHGTATPVGDVAEVDALNHVFGPRRRELPNCALGSVKSMISHLMPASGVAGLIKTSLALHHKVLPPTINCEEPNPKLGLDASVFYLNTETRPWIHGSPDGPRRAGVNAFGFGGINAHAVLEEYTGPAPRPSLLQHQWDSEVLILSGASRAEIIARGEAVLAFVERMPEARLLDLAYTLNTACEPDTLRLSIVAASAKDLRGKLMRGLDALRDERRQRVRDVDGIYFAGAPLGREGKVALLFPGEGSQYPNMLADLCVHFPEVRAFFDLMDRAFHDHPRGYLPSEVIFPPPGSPAGRLYGMDSGAEAVFAANQALGALLRALGVTAHAMAGHSTGEHSALLVSGMIRPEDDEQLIGHIREVNGVFEELHAKGEIPHGMLVAVGGVEYRALAAIVERSAGRVHIAMDNCPHQTVLCGAAEDIADTVAALQRLHGICQPLPFARAYHTPWFEVFCEPMREYFKRVAFAPTDVQLYSCVTADRYPADPEAVRELVATQWARTVRFRETIEAMHRDGIRVFIEAGPRTNLTGFVDDTLRGKSYVAVPVNVQHRSGVTQLNHLVGQLAAHAVPMRLEWLYQRRAPRRLDLNAMPQAPAHGARRVALATGLQPLRLSPEFRLRAAPDIGQTTAGPVAPIRVPASPVQPLATNVPPQRSPERPPVSRKAAVVAGHFQAMQQFLAVQTQVMATYLEANARVREGRLPEAGVAAAAGVTSPNAMDFQWGLVQNVSELLPGRQATAVRRFALDDDLLLGQHTLGRDVSAEDPGLGALSVVPLTITMEMLAETGALLHPGRRLIAMRNLRASRWIAVDEDGVVLECSARANPSVPDEVDVSVRERRHDGTMSPPIAEATLIFADSFGEAPRLGSFTVRHERPSAWRPEQLYREGMFHGPCFQVVKAVERFGEDGNVARLEALERSGLFKANANPVFLIDPVVLDGAGQVLAFWVKERFGILTDVFPYGLEELRVYGPPPPPGTPLECRVRAELVGATQTRCDIQVVAASGVPLYELTGWLDRRFELPPPFVRLRMAPADSDMSSTWSLPAGAYDGAGVSCRRIEGLTDELLDANGGIWLQVLAHLVLGRREREVWRSMHAVPKRRREWLLGRVVGKDAVRHLVRERFGLRLAPADVEILPGPQGQPEVSGAWTARLGIVPVVSISHSAGIAVALAALDRHRLIGIDIESVSQRKDGFEAVAFTAAERGLVASLGSEAERKEWYLRLWCSKEALGKALGRGLAAGIGALGVQEAELTGGAVTLRLGAPLAAEFLDLRDRQIVACTGREGDYVTSAVIQPW